MIDLLRLVLAVLVVQAHLWAAGQPWLAWQAVFGFYALSGYLMTAILNETYGFKPDGFARFALNRFLRLYPAYYVVLVLTVAALVAGLPISGLNSALRMPADAWSWFTNLALFGQVGFEALQVTEERLVPSAWSVSIELVLYVLLALHFAKSPRNLIYLLSAGILILGATLAFYGGDLDGSGFLNRYTVLQAGIVPFSLGGLIYFARRSRLFDPSPLVFAAILAAHAVNMALCLGNAGYQMGGGLYISVLINALLIGCLFRVDSLTPRTVFRKTLGGMAYPVFISHWLVGNLVIAAAPILEARSFLHFVVSLAVTCVLSLLIYLLCDRPLEILRARVRAATKERLEADLRPAGP
jgi:peptidoglycan/LPS O-acetylase OafA/YrhL